MDSLGNVLVTKTRNPGRGVVDECLVRFDSIQDHDFVQSQAPKLGRSIGKVGMCLELSLIHI